MYYSNKTPNCSKAPGQSGRVSLQSVFDNCAREKMILGENFILLWLNESEDPKGFYHKAKNNLWEKLKYSDSVLTENDLIEELEIQFEKELNKR